HVISLKSKCMKHIMVFTLLFLFQTLSVFAQQEKFGLPGTISDKHRLYTYSKSNWDGTHASGIFLYISDDNRLESFKWSSGDEWPTLVTAVVDWKTLTVTKFTNHRIFTDGRKQLMAELNQRG